MISAPTDLRYGRLESVGEGFRPLPNRHRAISREGTEALPYECTMRLSGTVGAAICRPRANTVRPYGVVARLDKICRGGYLPPVTITLVE